jgi:hypothetical protein
MTQDWAAILLGLGWDAALPLSYDRLTGLPDFTLADLADLPNATDYHETFHFVLNNYVSKDNRIPPYGFDGTEAAKRNALPVPAAQYGGNGSGTTYNYWDEFTIASLNPPGGADAADFTLYYQGTSWEYVLFLWKANNGTDPAAGGNAFLGEEGVNMLDAWINADLAAPMVPPFVMATATWGDTGCTVTEPGTEVTCDDGTDNDCDGLTDGSDGDCMAVVDCTQYSDKTTCELYPECRWNRKKGCLNR